MLPAGSGGGYDEPVRQSLVVHHLLEDEFAHRAAAYVAVADEQHSYLSYCHEGVMIPVVDEILPFQTSKLL